MRLAPEVPEVGDGHPYLLPDLTVNALLQGLPGLDESGERGVDPRREVWRATEKDLGAALDEYDDGRCEAGKL